MSKSGRNLWEMGDRFFAEKQPWDSLNDEIATWFWPASADATSTISPGEEFTDHLVDSKPSQIFRDLANALGSMLRPPDLDWFSLTVNRDDIKNSTAARQKLEAMTRTTRAAMYAGDAGYIRATKQGDFDFALTGNSVKSVMNNRYNNGLYYQTWRLKDCAWCEDQWGVVNNLHRKMKLCAIDMKSMFDEEKLPEAVKENLRNNKPYAKHEVRHVALPIDLYEPDRKFPPSARFASVYLTNKGDVLKETPEPEFPYVVSRWQTVCGWPYGYSPATMVALPDARLVQRIAASIIEATEKSTEPPLIATNQSILGPVSLSAGSITWVDSEYDERLGPAVRPLDLGKNAGLGQGLLDRKVAEMAGVFFLDKFTLPDTRNRTATEVRLLYQEFIRSTLPIFEPMERESIGAEIDLSVSKLMRLGAYGEDFPEELQGNDLTYEFKNPLRDARDRMVVEQYQESIGVIGAAAQFDPSVVSAINAKKMFRDVMNVVAPSDWLYTEKEAQERQDAAQEEQADQNLLSELSQGATTAREVALAAKELSGVTGAGDTNA